MNFQLCLALLEIPHRTTVFRNTVTYVLIGAQFRNSCGRTCKEVIIYLEENSKKHGPFESRKYV